MKLLAEKLKLKVRSAFPLDFINSRSGNALVLTWNRSSIYRQLWENFAYDLERYVSFSTTAKQPLGFENLEARIIACYHVIEKGLAMKNTRLGFGQQVIADLYTHLSAYLESGYDPKRNQFVSAVMVLQAYCQFHEDRDYDVSDYRERLRAFPTHDSLNKTGGGTLYITKERIVSAVQKNFETMAINRHSVRHFSEGIVDIDLVLKAIKIAQKSPSVCNRQSSFVYILESETAKKQALACQSGNRGFGNSADKILIVTSKLTSFLGIKERNQSFIDGGMFGMSLVYALHSLGLATCTLNWSVSKEKDLELRKEMPIKENEVVIFMVAVGHLPETLEVPNSQRKRIEEVFEIL